MSSSIIVEVSRFIVDQPIDDISIGWSPNCCRSCCSATRRYRELLPGGLKCRCFCGLNAH